MKCEIKEVNETIKYRFYCCYFDKYCTGTMLIDSAKKFKDYIESKESITLKELKKIFRYSSIGLYYSNPIHRIL